MKLYQLTNSQPKSKMKASEGLSAGKYKFFTSSPIQSKYSNKAIYKNEALIFGTGGNPSIHYCNEPFSTSTDCLVLYGNNDKVNLELIYYYLISNIHILENGFKGAGLKHISTNYILNININLPNENVNEILNKIKLIEKIISKKEEELNKLEIAIKSRFVEMFGDPVTNPYGWDRVTVGDVCLSIVRGPFGSALKKEFFVAPSDTTYKVYEQKHAIQKLVNIGTYYISAEKFNELRRFECRPGDIIMSCSGTMGELFQLPLGCEKGIINQALCKFTLNERILPVVFLTHMKETIGKLETKGSGIQNIAAISYVKAMPINLPPMDVQKQFDAFVAQIDKSKFEVQKSLEKLELLKKSLMQKYFG